MKTIKILSVALTILVFSCKSETKESTTQKMEHHVHQVQEPKSATKKKPLSPHTEAMALIGDAHIHIDYSSPGVRGRIIFGGLVGYDNVWQAGAHMATWMETNKDLIINGETLPAGKYGFFTIPSKGDWTVMINKNWDQHGKDEYDEKDDMIRFNVIPVISENITEHLEYKITHVSEYQGTISMAWEKITIAFPIEVKQD